MTQSERSRRFRQGLLLSSLLVFAVLRGLLLGPGRFRELALALLVEGLLWLWLLVTCDTIGRNGTPFARRLATLTFAAALTFSAGLVFAHTWFFDAAIERRLTLLDMTPAGTL